jgi:hypothetical protein
MRLSTVEIYTIAKTEWISIMEPNTGQPKAPESKPGSKPNAKNDLKSLPMPELQAKMAGEIAGLADCAD